MERNKVPDPITGEMVKEDIDELDQPFPHDDNMPAEYCRGNGYWCS